VAVRILIAHREDAGTLHAGQAVLGGERLYRIGCAGQVTGLGRVLRPHSRGGCEEVRHRAASLDHSEAPDRFDQILEARGGHESDVGGLLADEVRHVDEKSAAAAVLEIGIQHRFARSRDRLHDAIPRVHLIDEIAVDIRGPVLVEDLRLPGPAASEDKFEIRALLRQSRIDPLHHGLKVESLIRPVRARLLGGMQRIDNANLHPAARLGCQQRARTRQKSRRPGTRGTSRRQKAPPIHVAARTPGNQFTLAHNRSPIKHVIRQSTSTSP
jgi:hypothetical protein